MAGKLKDDTMTPSSSGNCANPVETSNAYKMAQPSRKLDVHLNHRAEKSPSKHKENESGTKTLGLMSLNDNKVGVYSASITFSIFFNLVSYHKSCSLLKRRFPLRLSITINNIIFGTRGSWRLLQDEYVNKLYWIRIYFWVTSTQFILSIYFFLIVENYGCYDYFSLI